MSDTITVRVLRVAGFEPGQEVPVEVDARGNPLDVFWRRRIRDAERDQCCEVVVHHGTVQESPDDEPWGEEHQS